MSAILLNQTPISGTYPEYHFGEEFHNQLWVEFENNNSEKWLGCFARSRYKGYDNVLVSKNNNVALVISVGIGYLIDINTKQVLHQMDDHPLVESAILSIAPDYIIASTSCSIFIFDNDGLIKKVEPDFLVDGIYFTEQRGTKLIGDLYSYMFNQDVNVGFEFDLLTFEIAVKQKVKVRRFGPFEYITVTNKDAVKTETSSFGSKMWERIKLWLSVT